jgi:phosphoenolpyruvate carboxylase
MSTSAIETVDPVTPDPATTPSPTQTHYQQVATQIIAVLNELAAKIPTLEGKHVATLDFVRTHQNVPLEFIETVTSAVELTPTLSGTQKFDAEEARDTLQFIQAFRPVYDLMNTLARDLKFTLSSRRAKITADSLQMYAIAKGIARDPNTPEVGAHVANMRRDLARKKPVRPKTPEPAPAPPSPGIPMAA